MIHLVLHGLRPLLAAAALTAVGLSQSPLTVGNLYVVRVGDGAATLTSASTATFVDEYTPAGALVQSIPMPTAVSGANQPLTNSGTATSEGFLNVSANGLYLTLVGYGTAPGLASVPSTTSTAVARVIGRIDLAGTVDTSTALIATYDGGNPRAAVSDDGQRFWTSGTGASNAGMRFVAGIGSTTSLGLNAGNPTNCRVATIYNGQLFTTSASLVYQGVCAVGTGLPTTGAQTIGLLNGFPVATGPSSYDHFFADLNTLWVADDRTNGNGGLQKWTQAGGVWTLQYTLALAANSGCRGVSGFVQGGVTTLWATANTGNLTQIVTGIDAGPGSPLTVIASAATNTALRGIRHLAAPSTLQRFPVACGAADIIATGNGQIGTSVITTVLNPLGFPFIGYGLTQLLVPFCNCTVAHDFTVLAGGPSHTLSIPNNAGLIGIAIYIQGLDFLAPGGCANPMLTLTDGYSFVIQ